MEECERTIEDLKEELMTLQRGDVIQKVRNESDVIVAASRQRHEREMFDLNRKLEELRHQYHEKVSRGVDELSSLFRWLYVDLFSVEAVLFHAGHCKVGVVFNFLLKFLS